MSYSKESQPLPSIQSINLAVPPSLEQAIAYSGSSRWLALHWEPELNQLCYNDGQTVGVGNTYAWQIFRHHPKVERLCHPYHLGDDGQPARHYLLLDRETRKLYVGESIVVEECLKQSQVLSLLAALDADSTAISVRDNLRSQSFWQERRTRATALGIALFLLLGLPAAGFGVEILEKNDWIEVELPEWLD